MCKWRRSNEGRLHWRDQGVSDLHEPVSLLIVEAEEFRVNWLLFVLTVMPSIRNRSILYDEI